MKSTFYFSNPSRLDLRLAAYAAAGASLALPAATTAKADIIYSGTLTLAVPQNVNGIYLDLATGASSTSNFTGYDINFYGTNILTFVRGSGTTLESLTSATAAPDALPLGTNIGPTAIFTSSSASTNFRATGTEYLGLRFTNTRTGAVNYGWVSLSTTAPNGQPATVTGYAFENTGLALAAGQVPEPGTTAALGLGALSLGAVGVRRWRKARQGVA